MEKEIKIKTKDGHIIYGNLNTGKKVSNKLIIFAHGFTGSKDEHQFFNAAKFFTAKGFDTFRFNFYGMDKSARKFEETKISQHGEDLNIVIKSFTKKYFKIYLVGHSYGGTTLLFADTSLISAYIFWDASYIPQNFIDDEAVYDKSIKKYIVDYGVKIIVGDEYMKELENFPDIEKMIKSINKPVFFIGASKGYPNDAKKYFKQANNPKELVVIKNADHTFSTLEAEQKLFEETFKFLKKY